MTKGFGQQQDKNITIYMNEIPHRIYQKIRKSVNHLTDLQIQANAGELGHQAVFAYLSEKIKNDETAQVTIYGDRYEHKPLIQWRVTKIDGQIRVDIGTLRESLGITDDKEWEEGLSYATAIQHLEPDEMFVHPLAETSEINGETMLNMYAVGMMFINCIRRIPLDDGDIGNPEQAEKFLTNMLFQVNPSIDTQSLIGKIKLNDKSAMMLCCTYLSQVKPTVKD